MTTDKTQITKEQLNLFVVCGKHYVTTAESSVLKENVNALLPSAIKKLKKVEREKELWRLNLCKKTSSKHIDRDKNGMYQFTQEDNVKLLEEFDKIDGEFIEVLSCIVSEFPEEGLTYDIRKAFEGIVIPKTEEVNDD
jgi:hypothetical protein